MLTLFCSLLILVGINSESNYNEEREALMSFYKSTTLNSRWKEDQNWLEAFVDHCEWYGIVCEEGKVISLTLPNNNLNGFIPSSISYLKNLKVIDLEQNQLSGSLPSGIGELYMLTHLNMGKNSISELNNNFEKLINLKDLNFSFNKLQQLPISLSYLTQLSHLNVTKNNLVVFPQTSNSSSYSELKSLDISYNEELQIVPSLWRISSLTHLKMSGVTIETLPQEINLLKNLLVFEMDESHLSSIPEEIGSVTNLKRLSLSYNYFSTLPWESMKNLTQLEEFYAVGCYELKEFKLNLKSILKLRLENSFSISEIDLSLVPRITSFGFSGTEIKSSKNLNYKIESLQIGGECKKIPDFIDYSILKYLYLSNSSISSWPQPLYNISLPSLISLSITSSNMMTIPYPEWVSKAPNLEDFFLLGTIKGTISSNIGSGRSLKTIQMADVINLEGTLPTELGMLTNLRALQILNVPGLVGPLPDSLSHLVEFGKLEYLEIDEVKGIDPELGENLKVLSDISTCSLGSGNEQHFTCTSESIYGEHICDVKCDSEFEIFGTWINEEIVCHSIIPNSKTATWTKTRFDLWRDEKDTIKFSSKLNLGTGCNDNQGWIETNGTFTPIETLETGPSSYLVKVQFEPTTRFIYVDSSISASGVRFFCGWEHLIPVQEIYDISNSSCSSSITSFTLLSIESCPIVYDFLLFDFYNNSLKFASDPPLFSDPHYCIKFPEPNFENQIPLVRGWVCDSDWYDTDDTCVPLCGDGFKLSDEKCDDGNLNSGDGCSNICEIEKGWKCEQKEVDGILSSSICQPICDDNNKNRNNNKCPKKNSNNSNSKTIVQVFVIGIVIILMIIIATLIVFNFFKKKKENYLILESQIELKELVSEGNFGQVYKGLWKGTTIVAVKVMKVQKEKEEKRNEIHLKNFKEEAHFYMTLPPHPNIVQLLGICVTTSPNLLSHIRSMGSRKNTVNSTDSSIDNTSSISSSQVMIVLEFMPHGSLLQWLCHHDFSPEYDVRSYQQIEIAQGISAGMHHLHSNRIIHRDLAARNILVHVIMMDSSSITRERIIPKITDFGMSASIKKNAPLPVRWTAPEVLEGIQNSSYQSDIWSFGVLLYEILTNGQTIPYGNFKNSEVMTFVMNGGILSPPEQSSPELKSLMTSCFRKEPELRPSFMNIFHMLNRQVRDSRISSDLKLPSIDIVTEIDRNSFERGSSDARTEYMYDFERV